MATVQTTDDLNAAQAGPEVDDVADGQRPPVAPAASTTRWPSAVTSTAVPSTSSAPEVDPHPPAERRRPAAATGQGRRGDPLDQLARSGRRAGAGTPRAGRRRSTVGPPAQLSAVATPADVGQVGIVAPSPALGAAAIGRPGHVEPDAHDHGGPLVGRRGPVAARDRGAGRPVGLGQDARQLAVALGTTRSFGHLSPGVDAGRHRLDRLGQRHRQPPSSPRPATAAGGRSSTDTSSDAPGRRHPAAVAAAPARGLVVGHHHDRPRAAPSRARAEHVGVGRPGLGAPSARRRTGCPPAPPVPRPPRLALSGTATPASP